MYKSMQQLSNRQHLVVKGSITSASPVVLTKTEVTHYHSFTTNHGLVGRAGTLRHYRHTESREGDTTIYSHCTVD